MFGNSNIKVMAHLMDKDALVAKINALLDDEFKCNSYDEATGFQNALTLVKKFIDTLEVKEVDYDKVLTEYLGNFENASIGHRLSIRRTAKHFFELGLKVQKGEEV